MHYDVFLSYNRDDRPFVEEIAGKLRDAGLRPFLDKWRLKAGGDWQEDLEQALAASASCAVFCGPSGLSPWHRNEMRAALITRGEDSGFRVIPVILPEAEKPEKLPSFLRVLTWVDFREQDPDPLAKLIGAIPRHRRKTPEPHGKIWKVPHRRNPFFTGRRELLDRLREQLHSGEPAALTQALRGLGGVGKTQTALEYVYRYAADYEVVWWVAAEEPATLRRDVAALAVRLGEVSEAEAADQEAAVAAARGWLERNGGWMVVFDNAAEPAELREILPRSASGHVLITSRRSDWGRLASLHVTPFERRESIRFLEQRAATSEAASELASELAEALGDFPLALEQAAAYIEQTGITVAEYLEVFRQRRGDVLARGSSEDHPETVATTWELSFEKLSESSPAATALLQLCSFLAPEDIPRDLIEGTSVDLPEPLAAAAGDRLAFYDAIAEARKWSLLEAEGESLSMHRLLQAITRHRCDPGERALWGSVAVRLADAAFGYKNDDLSTWERAGRILPHALAATRRVDDAEPSETVARLLNASGVYLFYRGELSTSLQLLRRSLAITEAVFGEEHNEVAIRANDIGQILKAQGDLDGALEYARRALAIDEAVYGKQHPAVATDANNIGTILKDQGDLDGALEYTQRALDIDEAVYGKQHPEVATDANNIGLILKDQGDLDGALDYARRALAIDEAVYGKQHPSVAIDANNIGQILKDQGDLDGVLEYTRRALAIKESVFGPGHAQTRIAAGNLAVLRALKDEP